MCNESCIIFGVRALNQDLIKGKRVLDIGSYDMNGSLRPIMEKWGCSEYIGVDIQKGKNVDIVARAEYLDKIYDENSFDVIISNETIEHIYDWRKAISVMKRLLKPQGLLLITTRSKGFNYHAHPYDYWRYEIKDMKSIFKDFEILSVESDPQEPGVFGFFRKPKVFSEVDLSRYRLYSIINNKRISNQKLDYNSWYMKKTLVKYRLKQFVFGFGKKVYKKI